MDSARLAAVGVVAVLFVLSVVPASGDELLAAGGSAESVLLVDDSDGDQVVLSEGASLGAWGPFGKAVIVQDPEADPPFSWYLDPVEAGQPRARLTGLSPHDHVEGTSPDGTRLLRSRDDRWELVRPDGSDVVVVAEPSEIPSEPSAEFRQGLVARPSLAPGRAAAVYDDLVLGLEGHVVDAHVRLVNLDTGVVTTLGRGEHATWSPSGDWILYQQADEGDGYEPGTWRLVRPDGSHGQIVPHGGLWSPDGTRIAGHDNVAKELRVTDVTTGTTVRITDVHAFGHLGSGGSVWSPDGSRLAIGTYDPDRARFTLATVAADGTDRRELIAGSSYLWAGWRPAPSVRIAGATRIDTAIQVSRQIHAAADTVVVARSDDYPDALAAGPMAHALGSPILLTSSDRLDQAVVIEIQRLGATTAHVIGSQHAIAVEVEDQLRRAGITDIVRHAGVDRFDTARLVATTEADGSHVYLTRGTGEDGWADAVGVAGLAAFERHPLLLTRPDRLPEPTKQALEQLGARSVTIVGGTAAVGPAVEDALRRLGLQVWRVAGDDRYATSAALASHATQVGASSGRLWLASGTNWPDALASGPAVAASGGVLLLEPPGPGAAVRASGLDNTVERLHYVGGPDVLTAGDRAITDGLIARR